MVCEHARQARIFFFFWFIYTGSVAFQFLVNEYSKVFIHCIFWDKKTRMIVLFILFRWIFHWKRSKVLFFLWKKKFLLCSWYQWEYLSEMKQFIDWNLREIRDCYYFWCVMMWIFQATAISIFSPLPAIDNENNNEINKIHI